MDMLDLSMAVYWLNKKPGRRIRGDLFSGGKINGRPTFYIVDPC